jgi:tight adherence protein C
VDVQAELLIILTGFAVALAVWAIVEMIIEAVQGKEERDEIFVDTPVFRLMLPFVQVVARVVERFSFLDRTRDGLDRKLVMAGKRDAITPDEVLGTCIITLVLGVLVAAYMDFMIGVNLPVYLALGFLGSFLPVMGLGDMIKKRHAKIRKALPYTLDLLTLAVEAGLDFTAALARIVDKLKGNPFQEEVRKLNRDLAMGKTRAEALRDMSDRIRLDDLQSVVSALVQADELGSALGPTLRIQAGELRRRRFQLAEKKAMQAPVKMLFPLVAFIFPLVFLVVFSPIVLKFLFMENRPF